MGASTAKGICYGLNIPLISIPTLDTISHPYLKSISPEQVIIPLIDARRLEVYYSVYNHKGKSLRDVDAYILSESSFQEYKTSGGIICGDGASKASDILFLDSFEYINDFPLASNMGTLAHHKYVGKAYEDMAYYSPYYFKPPNITKSKKKLI